VAAAEPGTFAGPQGVPGHGPFAVGSSSARCVRSVRARIRGYGCGAAPPSAQSGNTGAVAPGGTERLVTQGAGDDTIVSAVGPRRRPHTALPPDRRPLAPSPAADTRRRDDRSLRGRPHVVLVRPTRSFPPHPHDLAVVDARELAVRRRLDLPGFFTVDAISPDGRWLVPDTVRRRQRARLSRSRNGHEHGPAGRSVTSSNPREPDEQMGGVCADDPHDEPRRPLGLHALRRGEETFIHALDSVGRTADPVIDLTPRSPPTATSSDVRLRRACAQTEST
jgi:hypothetical protein